MFENKMGKQDSRLKEEARRALAAWKAAEEFLNHASDPALVDFAIYDLEAAKKKYLYLLGLLRQDMKNAKLQEPEPELLEQQEQA
ncbi:MAG: DUF2508 family protein [Clostridiales bacterium]|nr:DUF2508 family protein [Clostridiales bacterium]